ncbi:uncharacterized protein [Leptinotarsa decemlineata]|uniref:uncharacterized protein n=1 Tax=Leptinotarsa decemlineata TaxID=7539 RepID=UPI003D307798
MKVLIAICTIFTVGFVNCGFISSPTIVRASTYQTYTSLPSLAPVLQRSVPYVHQVPQPILSYQSPLAYAYPQHVYQHSVIPQPLYTPSVVNTPLYSGVIGGSSVVAQAPAGIASYNPAFQFPIFGSFPSQGQSPVQEQAPEQGQPPVESADSPASSGPQGDDPAPGATVDNDTVSVESA